MPNPHHRLHAAKKAVMDGTEVTDPKVRTLMAAFAKDPAVKPAVMYALKTFLSPYQRTVMDALHLGGATIDEMHAATEIPHNAIVAYGEYIFDNTVFTNRLERVEWVEEMQAFLKPKDAQILVAVMAIGVNYIVWYLTGRGQFTPAEVLRFTMNDAMFRSFAHRLAPLDSDTCKEAHNWARSAAQLAKSLQQIDPQDDVEARKQLYIALNHRDDTNNEQTTGISPESILH